jgi:hypothetical protein
MGHAGNHFVASKIHQMWQGDAKADFTVTFTDGTSHRVRIISLIDDCSRFILAALVVASESLVAVCRIVYIAVARYGLPDSFYADRGSLYDAYVFLQGLGVLGVRRINTKARNPSAYGKIEAYHRSLERWFIKELPHQPVTGFVHLQQLLDAFIDKIYNRHFHRELKKSPHDAFNNTISLRTISEKEFRIEKEIRQPLLFKAVQFSFFQTLFTCFLLLDFTLIRLAHYSSFSLTCLRHIQMRKSIPERNHNTLLHSIHLYIIYVHLHQQGY